MLEREAHQSEGSGSPEEMTPILPPLVSARGVVSLSLCGLQGEIKHNITGKSARRGPIPGISTGPMRPGLRSLQTPHHFKDNL